MFSEQQAWVADGKLDGGAANWHADNTYRPQPPVGALLQAHAGADMILVNYKGNAPALVDIVGGHVDLVFNGLTSATALIRGGKLRPIGVTSLARASAMPEVPTLDEQGLKGFLAVAWNGVNAPARTPKNIIDKISADMLKLTKTPELIEPFRLSRFMEEK